MGGEGTYLGRGKDSQVRSRLERDAMPGAEAGQGWQVTDTATGAQGRFLDTNPSPATQDGNTLGNKFTFSWPVPASEQQLLQMKEEHSNDAGALRTQYLVVFNSN